MWLHLPSGDWKFHIHVHYSIHSCAFMSIYFSRHFRSCLRGLFHDWVSGVNKSMWIQNMLHVMKYIWDISMTAVWLHHSVTNIRIFFARNIRLYHINTIFYTNIRLHGFFIWIYLYIRQEYILRVHSPKISTAGKNSNLSKKIASLSKLDVQWTSSLLLDTQFDTMKNTLTLTIKKSNGFKVYF